MRNEIAKAAKRPDLETEETEQTFVTYEGLTDKQNLFVHYYLQSFNGTQAASAAGYGNTEGSSSVLASQLLGNVKIRRAINEHLKAVAMSANEVLERLSDIAKKSTLDHFVEYDDSGRATLNLSSERARQNLRFAKKLTSVTKRRYDKDGNLIGQDETIGVELYSRLDALAVLQKACGSADEPRDDGSAKGTVRPLYIVVNTQEAAPIDTDAPDD